MKKNFKQISKHEYISGKHWIYNDDILHFLYLKEKKYKKTKNKKTQTNEKQYKIQKMVYHLWKIITKHTTQTWGIYTYKSSFRKQPRIWICAGKDNHIRTMQNILFLIQQISKCFREKCDYYYEKRLHLNINLIMLVPLYFRFIFVFLISLMLYVMHRSFLILCKNTILHII